MWARVQESHAGCEKQNPIKTLYSEQEQTMTKTSFDRLWLLILSQSLLYISMHLYIWNASAMPLFLSHNLCP